MCTANAHQLAGELIAADVVHDQSETSAHCRPHWQKFAAVLESRGYRLTYTNAALAVWERPGVG